MALHRARLKEFDDLLGEDVVDIKALKRIAFNGVPDEQGRRATSWKLMLNYLPPEKCSWEDTLYRKRELYKQFIDEMIVVPGASECDGDVTERDHPLSINPDSQWQTYFKDNEVLLQIDKDVRRLCPDISFFQQSTEFPCSQIINNMGVKRLHKRVERTVLKSANVERKGLGVTKIILCVKKASEDYAPMPEGMEAHWEVVERILFLYTKLNPGQGYVQGMNEIIGPIYFTFASDPNVEFRKHAEADTFFCFTNLMSEIRDFFIKTLDEADCGINSMITRLMTMLKNKDFDVWNRLQQLELRPQYYSFRWLTLMLSQEFPLPDVLRIWDSLFADESRFDFLIEVCCAMIIILRLHILTSDFSSNVKLLQNFPPIDVQEILNRAALISGRHY